MCQIPKLKYTVIFLTNSQYGVIQTGPNALFYLINYVLLAKLKFQSCFLLLILLKKANARYRTGGETSNSRLRLD